jgi:hypothetical protein
MALNASHTLGCAVYAIARSVSVFAVALKKNDLFLNNSPHEVQHPGQTRGGRERTHARQRIKHIKRTCTGIVWELKVSMQRGWGMLKILQLKTASCNLVKKNARYSAKARASSASHVLLRSCRRMLGASIFFLQFIYFDGSVTLAEGYVCSPVSSTPTSLAPPLRLPMRLACLYACPCVPCVLPPPSPPPLPHALYLTEFLQNLKRAKSLDEVQNFITFRSF